MSMTGVGWEFEVLQLRPVIKSCVLEWMQISKKKGMLKVMNVCIV